MGLRSEEVGAGGWRAAAVLGAVAVAAAAVGLRLAAASGASLWLDEFHTLHHARAESFGAFLASLRADNHPPLSFVLVRLSAAVSDAPLGLRLPSLLTGLAGIALAALAARRLPGRAAHLAAPAALAFSSLHLAVSAEARMYALLAFVVLGLLGALARRLDGEDGAVAVAVWCALGLHAHYHFLHVLAVLVPATVVLCAAVPAYRAAARPLAGALVAAVVLALPWYVWGFRAQLAHDLPPGGSDVGVRKLAEGIVHLLYYNVSLSGVLRPAYLAAGAVTLLLVAASAVRLVAIGRREGKPALGVLLAVSALVLPAWAALVAALAPRAGFHWTYLAASAGPFALLLGAEAAATGPLAGLRRGATWVVLALALALAVLNARAADREDYRGGVAFVLDHAGAEDALLTADWQPALFPHGAAWDYYAPRLAPADAPLPARFAPEDGFAAPEALFELDPPRVFVLARSLPPELPLFRALRARYANEEAHQFGESIFVVVFTDA